MCLQCRRTQKKYLLLAVYAGMDGRAFDALLSMVLAFNASADALADIGATLASFDYSRDDMAQIFFNNLIALNFFGADVSKSDMVNII